MNLRELRQKFAAMVAEAKKLTEEGKLEEAKAKTEEAKVLNEQIKQAEKLKEWKKNYKEMQELL